MYVNSSWLSMVWTTCRQARTLNFVLEYIEAMEFMLDHVLADGIGLEVSSIELESYSSS